MRAVYRFRSLVLYPLRFCLSISAIMHTQLSTPRKFRYYMLLLIILVILFYIFGVIDERMLPGKLTAPSPLSVLPLYPSRVPLINLFQFNYVINNDVCNTGDSKVFAVVLVHSHPANFDMRDTVRRNAPKEDLEDIGLRRVFLLARAEWKDQDIYRRTPQDTINEENVIHKDIVEGNFREHYHNLTYKHVMGISWAVTYCPQATFVIKMDDDIAVDLYQFRDRLKYRYFDRNNLILGLLQSEARPVRSIESKWYVSKKDFASDMYPDFMSGWLYAMTMDAAVKIVKSSLKLPYFWIDDVHVTGTLANYAGVKREGLNSLYTLHQAHIRCCLNLPNHTEVICDFVAAPSERDKTFMEEFLKHARACFFNPCSKIRGVNVARKCIDVAPLAPLGRGVGEVVKISG